MSQPKFQLGDFVRKTKGSQWQGRVVGTYSTSLTPEGYCVESNAHPGSVQIYPASALEKVDSTELVAFTLNVCTT
jgi:dihydrofolate reductase (trimethoprim resistance protein)